LKRHLFTVAALLVSGACISANAGYFDKATCENSRAYAKRVFLTKQLGMSYEKYRKVEGDPPPGPAGDLIRAIERGIFTNPKITSESVVFVKLCKLAVRV
jgi:hypothetical protein